MIRTGTLGLCATVVAASMALAGCGSSGSDNTQSAAPPASSGNTSAAATPTPKPCSTAVPAPGPLPTASAMPKGSGAASGMPAVTANATAMDKEPTLAKGTGSPPKNLLIRDLVVGKCRAAGPSDTVSIQYVGALYSDGSVFDATWEKGAIPYTGELSGFVPGFSGGLVGMQIGGRREIVIPGFLGYGEMSPTPKIPPNATLVFLVDMVGIQ